MQHHNELLRQRVLRLVEMFRERTANEPNPLSRERIREVIAQVVAEHEEESARDPGNLPRVRRILVRER